VTRLGLLFAFALSALAADAPRTPVILISIDTLRADRLPHMPNVQSWAHQGTVFTAIQSQIPLTLPSHTCLFTSTYPFQNRIEENAERVPPSVTLATVLRSNGYKTAAFVGSVLLDRRVGLAQGFDSYDSPFNLYNGASENPYGVRVRRDGALVFRAVRQWLDANRSQAIFVFLHLFDLHAPYSAAGQAGLLPAAAGYDTEVQYVDQLLGRFQQYLAQTGWWDRSLVILLSDHGESLGDHGETSHGYFIYQSTVWVPLVMHWPSGAAPYLENVTQPGGLIDIAPTILDFLKLPKQPAFEGTSLLDAAARHPVFSESVYARDAFRWAPLRSLRQGDWKYIAAPKPELYNLHDDPSERRNLLPGDAVQAQPLAAQLADLLARYAPARTVTAVGISAEARALLASLGYLGTGPGSRGGNAAPDPKDRLGEYLIHEKALTALYSSNFAAAIAGFQQVLAQDPRSTLARYYLGDAYLRDHQPDQALRQWNAALAAEPGYTAVGEAIGALWMSLQDYPKARAAFQQVLAGAPGDFDALLQLGIVEERLGLMQEARQHIQAACRVAADAQECERELHNLEQKK
jgi:tetratricopeptide (TPR) repeat protein